MKLKIIATWLHAPVRAFLITCDLVIFNPDGGLGLVRPRAHDLLGLDPHALLGSLGVLEGLAVLVRLAHPGTLDESPVSGNVTYRQCARKIRALFHTSWSCKRTQINEG